MTLQDQMCNFDVPKKDIQEYTVPDRYGREILILDIFNREQVLRVMARLIDRIQLLTSQLDAAALGIQMAEGALNHAEDIIAEDNKTLARLNERLARITIP